MARSFFATLFAYWVGFISLAGGMALLTLVLGPELDPSLRRADYLVVVSYVLMIGGIIGGFLSFLFWILFAWPFHAPLLRFRVVNDNLIKIGSIIGPALGVASAAVISFSGGLLVTLLLAVCGTVSGITFCMMIRYGGKFEQTDSANTCAPRRTSGTSPAGAGSGARSKQV